jgi:hypothetical protein
LIQRFLGGSLIKSQHRRDILECHLLDANLLVGIRSWLTEPVRSRGRWFPDHRPTSHLLGPQFIAPKRYLYYDCDHTRSVQRSLSTLRNGLSSSNLGPSSRSRRHARRRLPSLTPIDIARRHATANSSAKAGEQCSPAQVHLSLRR